MKNKKLLFILLSIYGLYCFSLAFIAPVFIKSIIPEQAKNFIHGDVSVEKLNINPLTNSITLSGLTVRNAQGHPIVSFDTLSVNVELLPFIFLKADLKSIAMNNLQLFSGESSEKKAWLTLPYLHVAETSVGISQQEIYITEIFLEKLLLAPILKTDQSTNIDLFLAEIDTLLISSDVVTEQESETEPWVAHIANIQIKDANVSLLDQTVITEQFAQGISTVIHPININLASVHSDFSKDISLNLNAALFKGQLEVKGKINPNSMHNTFTYQLNDSQLSELNAYVEHFSLASIVSGTFSTHGEITTYFKENEAPDASEISESNEVSTTEIAPKKSTEKPLEVKVNNSSAIKSLVIKHQLFETPLLNCANISSDNLNFLLLASNLALDKLSINECLINPSIDKNNAGNFDLAKTQKAEAAKQTSNTNESNAQSSDNKTLNIDIKLVELINNTLNIEDFSQGERVNVHIGNIQATMANISVGENDLTNYELSALLNKHAPLAIQGNGNFLNPKLSTQGTVTLKNLGLKEFSPYALNISSRTIDKGVLALDITIDVEENQLDSLASIDLLGLELGRKQNIEGASKLPIGLALSILKDTKGNINIGIPVKGDLEDPTFSVNKQIIKTLTGIITKAATAPLSMVGGLVTGGDNTNSLQIIFEEEQTTLNEQQQKNITEISKVLKKRPELSVRLVSLLNANERLVVTDNAAQNDLMTQRQTAVMNSLLALEVSPLQIDMNAIDSSLISENSEVSIEFFSR